MNKFKEEIENKLLEYNADIDNTKPYLVKLSLSEEKTYNPNYGDNKECLCGCPYYRHFDTYEDMYACGCKYCDCYEFEEIPKDFVIPEFVKMYSSYLRRNNKKYYCYFGAWGVDFEIIGGKIYSISDMKHLNNKELISITEEEYNKNK